MNYDQNEVLKILNEIIDEFKNGNLKNDLNLLNIILKKLNIKLLEIGNELKIVSQKKEELQQKINFSNNSILELNQDKETFMRIKEKSNETNKEMKKKLIMCLALESLLFSNLYFLISKLIVFLLSFASNFILVKKIDEAKKSKEKSEHNYNIILTDIKSETIKLETTKKAIMPYNKKYEDFLNEEKTVMMIVDYINTQIRHEQNSNNHAEYSNEQTPNKLTKRINFN